MEFLYWLFGNPWKEIRKLPRWANRALPKQVTHRYDRTFHIKGKNFIYKMVNVTHGQGNYEERFYKKRRH